MLSYKEVKKLTNDNYSRLITSEIHKTKKGELKKNLPKKVYFDLLAGAGIYVPSDKKQKTITKKELYNEAKKRGLKPDWIRSTKSSLQQMLDESILSSKSEIDAFFANEMPDTEINIRARDFINYITGIRYNKNVRLRLGVLKDSEMTYKFLTDHDNLNDIVRRINNGIDINDIQQHGSDMDLLQEAVIYGSYINLTWLTAEAARKINRGKFMPYYHILPKIDLSRYQFYHVDDEIKDNETCFLYALRMAGIPNQHINLLKLKLIQDNLNINDIKFIAEELNIRVNLTYYDDKHKFKRNKSFNLKAPISVDIGLISGHYFINEQTNITMHAIKYYHLCADHQYFPSVYNNHGFIEKTNYKSPALLSFDVILGIIKCDLIRPITLINCSKNNTEKLTDYTYLVEPKESEIKPYFNFKQRRAIKAESYNVIFADFETFISEELGYHIPYCLSYSFIDTPEIHNIYGLDCAKKFLNSLTDNAIIITHNLSFDFKMMQDYLKNIRQCIQTGTQIKTITASYGKYQLVFKDNCAFLSGKLSDLPSKFNLDTGDKEAYPYSLINAENYDHDKVPVTLCLQHLKKEQHQIFLDNCRGNHFVDIKAYTIKYCNQDVRILKEAFICFRKQILKVSEGNIDIIHSISLSQMADDFFRLKGCFDGCYKISGIAHNFIRRCIVGGRVMCRNNEKLYIRKLLQDFDAVSLYPSAMYRLEGYLMGIPKVIHTFTPDKYDHYFVEVRIDSIGKKYSFPLVSIKTDEGIHNFTNDLVGRNIYVDKTTLEDLVKWQKVTYTFIRGYYFDEGYNDTIKTVIKDVFDLRQKYRKDENPLEETYKLIMNCSYGKMCQKAINRKIVFKNPNIQSTKDFLINNYDKIIEYTQINDHLIKIVIEKSIESHYAPVHLACQVLSMSKRIMNEVMCLAEDNDINIYYQDTDSMHIDASAIDKLRNIFRQTYGRELIGSNMGQFHSDFKVSNKNAENIISIESIFLGKKCYIDKLQYSLPNDPTLYYAYHIRMKGINSKAILDVNDNPFYTYFQLYNGLPKVFDLAPYCVMQCTKTLRMVARKVFERMLQF